MHQDQPTGAVADPMPQTSPVAAPPQDDHGVFYDRYYARFILGLFLLAVVLGGLFLWPFVHPIVFAVVLATLCAPLQERLARLFGGREWAAASTLTILATLFLVLPLTVLLVIFIGQGAEVATTLLEWYREGGVPKALAWVSALPWPEFLRSGWQRWVLPHMTELQGALLASGGKLGSGMLDVGRSMLADAGHIAVQFVMMLFFLFFFLKDRGRFVWWVRYLCPLRVEQEDRIFQSIRHVSRSVLLGSMATGAAQGVATAVGFAISGLNPFFWGMVAIFASFIPVVGIGIILAPACGWLFATGSWGYGIFLTLWWLVVISSIDNVLRPVFMRGGVEMNTFWVFVSILGGMQVFGIVGLLYGPISLSLVAVVLQMFVSETHRPDMPNPNSGLPCPTGPTPSTPAEDTATAERTGRIDAEQAAD